MLKSAILEGPRSFEAGQALYHDEHLITPPHDLAVIRKSACRVVYTDNDEHYVRAACLRYHVNILDDLYVT